MNTRLKLIAATLGLVVATGAIGDASAATVIKTVRTTKVVTHHAYRPLPLVRHVRIVRPLPVWTHRAPILGYRVTARPFVATTVRKVVRIVRRPLPHRHAMNHRIVSKTVIR